jgi:hypothetical protein
MVTGFNTDVKHEGRVYHVQTEDKGLQNPIIETLIYMGGEILTARRTSYADLVERGVEEMEIARRIESQHNRTILDIKNGKFDGKRVRPFGEGIISDRSFDAVVLDWLKANASTNRIALKMTAGKRIVEGETARLELLVYRARDGEGLAGARVKVRWISTVDRPRTLAEGETDGAGKVVLECPLPLLADGNGALIIQTHAGQDTAELKQLVRKPARRAAG